MLGLNTAPYPCSAPRSGGYDVSFHDLSATVDERGAVIACKAGHLDAMRALRELLAIVTAAARGRASAERRPSAAVRGCRRRGRLAAAALSSTKVAIGSRLLIRSADPCGGGSLVWFGRARC